MRLSVTQLHIQLYPGGNTVDDRTSATSVLSHSVKVTICAPTHINHADPYLESTSSEHLARPNVGSNPYLDTTSSGHSALLTPWEVTTHKRTSVSRSRRPRRLPPAACSELPKQDPGWRLSGSGSLWPERKARQSGAAGHEVVSGPGSKEGEVRGAGQRRGAVERGRRHVL